MRSAIVATSLASVVAADASGTAGTYADCVSTCKPVLDVSSQCGLPVPSNYQFALDPNTWSNPANWLNPAAWNGQVPSVGWSTAGGPAPWDAWGGGAYGGGPWSANAWSNGWNVANWLNPQSVQCVCSTKAFDLKSVGTGCLTCLSQVNTVSNPCKSILPPMAKN